MNEKKNEISVAAVANVWAVCHESGTYGSKEGKAREGLPIPTRYPSSLCRQWWMP